MRKFGEDLNRERVNSGRSTKSGAINTTSEGGKYITLTTMQSSQIRNIMNATPYGISSAPLTGLVAFTVSADSGGRDGIIGVFDPKKPSVGTGEVMLYSSGDARVYCKANGSVLIQASGAKIECTNTGQIVIQSSDGAKIEYGSGKVLVDGMDVVEEINTLKSTVNDSHEPRITALESQAHTH